MSMTGTRTPADAKSASSGRAFRYVTVVLLLLVAALLGIGLLHKSSEPEVLGRYSLAYTSLLMTLLAIAICLLWILLRGGPRARRWTGNIYLLLISLLATVLAVEWGLRIINPFGIQFFHNLPYHMQGMIDDPVLGYRVYFGPNANTTVLQLRDLRISQEGVSANAPQASFKVADDLGLADGGTACFRVVAYNALGDSEFSDPVCDSI